MFVTKQRAVWLALGTLWSLLAGYPAFADDTELFVVDSSQFPEARPNVLLILDTSGSMDDEVSTQPPYDAAMTYTGACDSNLIYWRTHGYPDCANTDRYFEKSYLKCDAASGPLARNGYYPDEMAQYNPNTKQWGVIKDTAHQRDVECRADWGKHGDGVDTSKVYPRDGNAGPWATTRASGENRNSWWGDHGDGYVLFDGNWLNWAVTGLRQTSRKIDIVKEVATSLLDSVNGINVGLMRYNTNVNSPYDDGGPVIYAMEDIATARDAIKDKIEGLPASGNTPLAETMYEAALYYRGMNVRYGDLEAPERSVDAARTALDPDIYKSPVEYSCQKNFIVYLSDGLPTSDTNADSRIENMTGQSCSGDCLDELADFLYHNDQFPDDDTRPGLQNVVTHTIGFGEDIPVLEEAAQKGGGKYYQANNTADLSAAFANIVTDILQTQTTFTSPAIAINSFNRTQNLNDLYITMFQPAGTVHWPGNLKRYRLRASDSTIVDKNGEPAVLGDFFSDSAQSYWSASVDGAKVVEGGAAHNLPDPSSRHVYTCLNCAAGAALTADSNQVERTNTAIDATVLALGTGDPSRDSLIDFIRGMDVTNVDGDSSTTVRYQMGDPLHAKPIPVMYSADVSLVFFATNDGYLHAINTSDGTERWAFIPEEFLPDMKLLYTNATSSSKHYAIDGSLRVQVVENNNGVIDGSDKVYLYFGLRRGGDTYYALDVTNPDAPTFLWKKSSSDLTMLGQTWSNPVPTRVNVSGGTYSGTNGANNEKLVVIFGAGYDTSNDQPGLSGATTPDAGNGIIMLDAVNGNLLWHATKGGGDMTGTTLENMNYAFPADIKVVDLDGDRFADRLYAADMGGQVWRFDVFNGQAKDALVHGGVIAQLGGAPATDPAYEDVRRFYYAPDVALVRNKDYNFMHIGIGSGHRASPNTSPAHDRFYALRDPDPFDSLTQAQFNAREADPITDADLMDIRDVVDKESLESLLATDANGWKMELRAGTDTWSGEKVLAEARTFDNRIYFTTFTPGGSASANDCRPRLGTNRLYMVDLFTGRPITNLDGSADGDDDSLTAEDRYMEVGGSIAAEPVFLFPQADDPEDCVGEECRPNPVMCVDLFCMPLGANPVVRTYWREDRLDE